jgi:hypothetical protein
MERGGKVYGEKGMTCDMCEEEVSGDDTICKDCYECLIKQFEPDQIEILLNNISINIALGEDDA